MLGRFGILVVIYLALAACAGRGGESPAAQVETQAPTQTAQAPESAWPGEAEPAAAESPWPGEQETAAPAQAPEPAAAAENASPWPEFLADSKAEEAPVEGCLIASELPKATELARIEFDPYRTDAPSSGARAELLKVVARSAATNQAPIYLMGTSFNPSERASRLRELAIQRARSVAQVLQENGVADTRITCVPKTGKRPPSADLDRVVVIYVGAGEAP